MNQAALPGRRGVALLIVLATLVLCVVASAGVARSAATAKMHRDRELEQRLADDLLHAAEAPVLAWLAERSASVVLPPDAAEPAVHVLHDAWIAHGRDCEVTITAWDQCGMAPVRSLGAGSPLRSAVPDEVLRRFDRASIDRGTIIGLDLFIPDPDGGPDESPFPEGVASQRPPALGAFVATHQEGPGRINVNTAPASLVEAALRLAGRDGLERIMHARRKGYAADTMNLPRIPDEPGRLRRDAGARPRQHVDPRPRDDVQLVGSSNAWSFRIDLRVGALRRSWWAVHVATDSRQWRCVQRLVIAN